MRRLFVFAGSAVMLFAILVPRSSLSQVMTLDSLLTISTPSTFDSVLILAGGQLTADAQITVLGNMTIDSGGVVTHSARLLDAEPGTSIDFEVGGSIIARGEITGGATRMHPIILKPRAESIMNTKLTSIEKK